MLLDHMNIIIYRVTNSFFKPNPVNDGSVFSATCGSPSIVSFIASNTYFL